MLELLRDPSHYRRSEMQVVDYSDAPPQAEDLLPSFGAQPEPSRWQRFVAWVTREAGA